MPSLIGGVLLISSARALRRAPAIPESTGRVQREPGRYRKASLPPQRVAESSSRFWRQTMERDRPYLDSKLSLSALASSLGITSHQLSPTAQIGNSGSRSRTT